MLVRSSFEGSCRGGGRAVGDDRASGGVGDEGGGLGGGAVLGDGRATMVTRARRARGTPPSRPRSEREEEEEEDTTRPARSLRWQAFHRGAGGGAAGRRKRDLSIVFRESCI